MNRQAVPSIFLSVAIVCFFAIVLYERDPHPRRPTNRAGATPSNPIAVRSAALSGSSAHGADPPKVARSDLIAGPVVAPDRMIRKPRDAISAIAQQAPDRPTGAMGGGRRDDREPTAVRVISNRSSRTGAEEPAATDAARRIGTSASRGALAAVGAEADDVPTGAGSWEGAARNQPTPVRPDR